MKFDTGNPPRRSGGKLRQCWPVALVAFCFLSLGAQARLFGQAPSTTPTAAGSEPQDADAPPVTPSAAPRKTVIIRLEGDVSPSMRAFFERNFEAAKRDGAEVIVLDIDSPGGRLDTTLEMSNLITSAEEIETIAFVRRSAYSGAAVLALSCDRIEMHSEALLGDIGVIVGGPFSAFQYVEEKQRSPVVAAVRTLADRRNRPAALAEAMVDKDITVYEARHKQDDRRAYFTNKEWESIEDAEQWEQGRPVFEAREDQFLTVNGKRALELGLIEGTSRSLDEVLGKANAIRPARVLAWSWYDTMISVLNSIWMAWLLILIGIIALIVELSAPGMGVGGLLSLLCFSLFFWSRFLGGTAGWLEVTLFLASLMFIAAEFFVIPGFGVAGISGFLLMVLSLVMASQRILLPATGEDWSSLGLNLLTVCAALGSVFVIVFLAADYFGDAPVLRRFMLDPPKAVAAGASLVASDKPHELPPWERLGVGDLGRSISTLRPSGKALFAEEIVDVTTEGEFIDAETEIRIFRKQPGRIIVREA